MTSCVVPGSLHDAREILNLVPELLRGAVDSMPFVNDGPDSAVRWSFTSVPLGTEDGGRSFSSTEKMAKIVMKLTSTYYA